MDSVKEVWTSVLEYIKERFVDKEGVISNVAYKTWICCLNMQSLNENDVVLLTAKSEFQVRTCSKYSHYLKVAFEEILGFPVTLRMIPEITDEERFSSDSSYTLRRELYATDDFEPAKVNLAPTADSIYSGEYTFANFIVGSSNKFAHAAALAVAQNPAGPYNPLFIYGPSGLGKTHLLNAIKNEILNNRPSAKILIIKGVDFTNGIVEALKNGTINDYHRAFQQIDVLLVDDIQFIAGKERTQEEFFHTFNRLFEAKKQIVLASDRPPKEIQALEERLRNRFEMGLMADIQYPDFETRVAILKRKAESLNLNIDIEVCEFIANRLKSNIRQLEGTIKKLKVYSELDENANINLSLAQIAVSDTLNEESPAVDTFEKIMDEVCRIYSVSREEIASKKRTMPVSQARRVAMYVIRTVMEMSLPTIGDKFNRDHSTVIYSINQVEIEMKENSFFKSTVEDIIKNVKH